MRKGLLAGLLLLLGGILAVAGYAAWRLRADALEKTLELSAVHARSLESLLTQSLHASELAAVAAERTAPGKLPKRLAQSFAETLRHTPFLRSISLADNAGRIIVSSNPANAGRLAVLGDLLPPPDGADEILHIGRPWEGRDFADGRPTDAAQSLAADAASFIPVVRTISRDGQRQRLIIAVNPDFFASHIARSIESTEGAVEVLRYDGVVLMSTAAGSHSAATFRRLRLQEREAGRFVETWEGGRFTLTAFRASSLYPLVVVTRLEGDPALSDWRQETRTLFGVVIPLVLLAGAIGILYLRRQRQLAEQRAEAERLQRINATVFNASADSIIITDAEANIVAVNQAFTAITGYGMEEVLGRNPRLLASGLQSKAFYEALWEELLRAGVWRGELTNKRKDGSLYDAQATITAVRGGRGGVRYFIGVTTDITARKAAERQIKELNRDFVSFLENTSDFIYFKDADSRFRFCSQTLARITGHASWREMTGKHDREVFPPDTALIYQEEERPVFAAGRALLGKVDPYYDEHGRPGWVSTNKWPLLDDDGRVIGLFGISRDITQQKEGEERLKLAASVFSHAREAIMITAADGAILEVNEAFTRITGYGRDEVLGRNPRLLNSGRQSKEYYAGLWRDLIHKGHWSGEVWNRRKSGEVFAELLTISAVADAEGRTRHYVSLFSDITPIKEHEKQLEHIAHYDALTGLPNRVLLADRLHQAMTQTQRRRQRLAVAYLDLDGFKQINDQHGHDAGDRLLMTVAARMKQALREGDTLARLGGDEFVAVLLDLADVDASVPLLERLLAAAAEPVHLGELVLRVSVSVGVTFYPQAEEIEADQLLRQADQSMYQAKLAGKNRYHVFDANQDRDIRSRMEDTEAIRHALAAGEFTLLYQPKVNMRSGKMVGVEALLRWQRGERLISPLAFLPAVEDHPLIVDIGDWVIGEALAQAARWSAAGLMVPISVNIAARHLQVTDFVERLAQQVQAHPGLPRGILELEVLETSALEDLARASAVIDACNELGVSFALDDFGTGYSSLTYLKRLAITQLKIDQSFVRDMLDDPDDLTILDGVLGLATAFRRQALAEGVESVEHGEMLLELGCELAQGYVIARPMPAAEIPVWHRQWAPPPSWPSVRTVAPEDVPVLFAIVEHRAWVLALEGYARGELPPPPTLDHCRFGAWLGNDGARRYGAVADYPELLEQHRQIHALGEHIEAARKAGTALDQGALLSELRTQRDALIATVRRLIRQHRPT